MRTGIPKQTSGSLRQALAPKMDAAVRLRAALWPAALASSVQFSSLTGLLGTAGQANYAAANLALDAWSADLQASGMTLHYQV